MIAVFLQVQQPAAAAALASVSLRKVLCQGGIHIKNFTPRALLSDPPCDTISNAIQCSLPRARH